MSARSRFVLATLCGLVLGGLVHLSAVLAIPFLGERDAFSRLKATATSDQAELVAGPSGASGWLPRHDPAVALATCAYDLAEGPVRISARTGSLFQSLSFHARGGGVFFAVTDRAAVRGVLDLVVMTRAQLDEALAAEDEDEPSRDVRIVAPRPEGLVVVRTLATSPSLQGEAEAAATSVSCTIDPQPGE